MRIDIHHHFFPASLNKAESNKALGWRTPEEHLPWSPEVSLKAMDASGVDKAILSLPALNVFPPGQHPKQVARERNEMLAKIRSEHPHRFGFFASLPLVNVDDSVAELVYALDLLCADGIAMASCYGLGEDAKYIGDEIYDPVWRELNRRKAVVFLHGAAVPSSTQYPHDCLGVPVCDVPNETFKAAAHLVVTGTKRRYPNVKIILAHLGGTTPFLASRVAVLSRHMGCKLSTEEILEDFKTFYFDTALASDECTLEMMQKFVGPERLVFGTDLPAVSVKMASWYTKNLEAFYQDKDDSSASQAIFEGNARRLLPTLSNIHQPN